MMASSAAFLLCAFLVFSSCALLVSADDIFSTCTATYGFAFSNALPAAFSPLGPFHDPSTPSFYSPNRTVAEIDGVHFRASQDSNGTDALSTGGVTAAQPQVFNAGYYSLSAQTPTNLWEVTFQLTYSMNASSPVPSFYPLDYALLAITRTYVYMFVALSIGALNEVVLVDRSFDLTSAVLFGSSWSGNLAAQSYDLWLSRRSGLCLLVSGRVVFCAPPSAAPARSDPGSLFAPGTMSLHWEGGWRCSQLRLSSYSA
jgi:hypothetical protein